MTGPFKEDRIKNEKDDPSENSSLKFINIPIVLLSMFLGFGVTYLILTTPDTDFSVGDSRTTIAQEPIQTDSSTEDSGPGLSQLIENGKKIYSVNCQACHQTNGAGIPGAFPPLDNSEWVLGSKKRLAAIVLHGLQGEITVKGQKYNGVMPPFKDVLSQDDIAAVTTYLRTAWSNRKDAVTTDVVKAVSAETQSKGESWAGEVELNKMNWN